MKCFIYLLLLIFISPLSGQDEQWYIKEGVNTSGTPISNPIYLENIWHPKPEYVIDTTTSINPRNDVFIIYDNNSYFNSRYIEKPFWDDGIFPNKGYSINSNNEAQYLYFTNNYEGNDPDALVSNTVSASGMINEKNIEIINSEYIGINRISPLMISANHDIARGTDITLILSKNVLYDNINKSDTSCLEFTLCFDNFSDGVSTVDPDMPLQLTGASRVFDGSYTLGLNVGMLQNNCIENISFESNFDFGYINLRSPNYIHKSLLGKEVKFKITTCDPLYSPELLEKVRDSHDPNYVKLECIRSNPNYAYYKLHCVNEDMSSAVNNLSMSFIPPNGFVSVHCTGGTIGGGALNCDQITPVIDPVSNEHVFQNLGQLSAFNPNAIGPSSADLFLCVKMNSSIDVTTAALEPSIPSTYFDDFPYAIHDFYDQCQYPVDSVQVISASSQGGPIYGIGLETILEGETCTRSPTSDCHCKCGPTPCPPYNPWCCRRINWPSTILLGLLGFLTIYLISRAVKAP